MKEVDWMEKKHLDIYLYNKQLKQPNQLVFKAMRWNKSVEPDVRPCDASTRWHHSMYLIVGTCSQSSSSSNDGISSSIFLCGGMSFLVTVFTRSDTLQKHSLLYVSFVFVSVNEKASLPKKDITLYYKLFYLRLI